MPIQTSKIFEQVGYKLTGTCKCGRVDTYIHCPQCGAVSVIVLNRLSKTQTVLLPNGARVPDRVFRCKQCAQPFPESMCFRMCEAAPLTWARESEVVDHVVKHSGQLPESQLEVLRHLAKKNPNHAEKIKAKLGETGLLERRDKERASQASVTDPETAKLFEPPKLDEGGES